MLTAGDEFGRTQHGNNNPYCQDNEVSWVDWDLDGNQQDMLDTTTYLLGLRRRFHALRSDEFFRGRPFPERPDAGIDLAWFTRTGHAFTDGDWHNSSIRSLQMVRNSPRAGERAVLMVINGSLDPVDVALAQGDAHAWELIWDSTWEHPDEQVEFGGTIEATTQLEPLTTRVYGATRSQ